jgi:small conductance mechanosensitive channel
LKITNLMTLKKQRGEILKYNFNKLTNMVLTYGVQIVIALFILIVGLILIKFTVRIVEKLMIKANKDKTLRTFTISLLDIFLKVMLFITIVSMLGVKTASFVAIIGAGGIAIGLALQGSLSNLASGVLILAFRPFAVGNFIEVKTYSGKVEEIQIFHTVVKGENGFKIIIPNSMLSSGNIIVHLDK